MKINKVINELDDNSLLEQISSKIRDMKSKGEKSAKIEITGTLAVYRVYITILKSGESSVVVDIIKVLKKG